MLAQLEKACLIFGAHVVTISTVFGEGDLILILVY
jgi:hypothetical protein